MSDDVLPGRSARKTGRGPGRSNRGSQHSDRSNLGGHKEQAFGAAIPKKIEPKRPSRRTKMIKNRAPEGLERFDRFHTPILAVLFFPAALHFRLSSAARFCMLLQITGFRETSLKFRLRIIVCDFVEVCDQERLFSIDADVYLRLSSIIETRWTIFQRKPSFFMDLIGRDMLFEICSISGKCLLIIFRSGCRARQRTFPPAGDLFMFLFS